MWRLILYRLGKFQDRRSIIIYCTMGGRNVGPVWHCFHDVLHPMLRLGCAQFGLCCKWVLFPLKNRTCSTMWFWILHLHLHQPFWQEEKKKPTWWEGKTGRRVMCRCCPINKLKREEHRRKQIDLRWIPPILSRLPSIFPITGTKGNEKPLPISIPVLTTDSILRNRWNLLELSRRTKQPICRVVDAS